MENVLQQRALPAGPDRVFRCAEPILTRLLGKGAYRLGGGTALATVWSHRHSTDVDLFADQAAYGASVNSQAKEEQLKNELFAAMRPLHPEAIDVTRGFLKIVCRDGELGLYTPLAPLDGFPATDRVAGCGVALERPAVILARKIHGRMLRNGVLTLRDMYDIAAASVLAPEELAAALKSVRENERESLCDELQSLTADWAGNPVKGGHPLLQARLPAELAEDPAICVRIARELFAGDWSWAKRVQARLEADSESKPRAELEFKL